MSNKSTCQNIYTALNTNQIGSKLKSFFTSEKTGFAPFATMALAGIIHVNGVVIISFSLEIPDDFKARYIALLPDETPRAYSTPR